MVKTLDSDPENQGFIIIVVSIFFKIKSIAMLVNRLQTFPLKPTIGNVRRQVQRTDRKPVGEDLIHARLMFSNSKAGFFSKTVCPGERSILPEPHRQSKGGAKIDGETPTCFLRS